MKTLILDSSTKILYIAIISDNDILFEKYISGFNDHAKHIVKTIEDGLNENNLTASDLTTVVCGIGPGSYTGVRMAVTVAKMFATFTNIELRTISTLALMSSGFEGKVLCTIDARRGNAFAAIYEDMKPIIKEAMISVAEIKQNEYANLATEEAYKVDPFKVINASEKVANHFALIPNYLRETEAERNIKND